LEDSPKLEKLALRQQRTEPASASARVQLKAAHVGGQALRLVGQGAGGRCGLFNQRGVLLSSVLDAVRSGLAAA
jgi:hypothetical protein